MQSARGPQKIQNCMDFECPLLQIIFPKAKYFNAHATQTTSHLLIPLAIALYFVLPKGGVLSRSTKAFRACMPEAAINKYCNTLPRKVEVRFADYFRKVQFPPGNSGASQ